MHPIYTQFDQGTDKVASFIYILIFKTYVHQRT